MGFIDKKERIVDICLTSYGKSLLSKGILDFDHFVLVDTETQYLSSSYDKQIESLPVFESLSTIDVSKNNLISGNHKNAQPKIVFTPSKFNSNVLVATTASLSIVRKTEESIYEDPILSRIDDPSSEFTLTDKYNRISSLKNRGLIADEECMIDLSRLYSSNENNQGYIIEIELSNSLGTRQLLSTGSVKGISFGISDDNENKYNESNEKHFANNFVEIIKVNEEKSSITLVTSPWAKALGEMTLRST